MTIEDLRAFVYLYQLRSFTKTAQRIHLSQPELSKRIHHLEDELNVQLVDTSNRRRLKITPGGKAVYQHANTMLDQYQQMMNELASLRKVVQPSLVVGAVPITGQYGITTQVSTYNQHFPKSQIRLIENEGDQVLEQLQRGEIDAAILRDTQSGELNELEYSRVNLAQDQLVVVMDCHHPLAKQQQVTIQDLKDVPLVSLPLGSGVYEPIVEMMKDAGLRPDIIFQSTHIETLREMLKAHQAVSILFKQSVAPFMTTQLVGKPLTPPFISNLQFIYPRKRGSYQLQRLTDYLKQ